MLNIATPPIFTVTPPYTKDALFSSALNYFGMFVMTFHYEWRLQLASLVKVIVKHGACVGNPLPLAEAIPIPRASDVCVVLY